MTTINWASPDYVRYAVDVTGDGRADLVAFGPDGIYVAKGHGDGAFDAPVRVVNGLGSNDGWTPKAFPRLMGDITGDGRADVVGFGIDGVWTALSNGDGTFAGPRLVLANFGTKQSWKVENHPRLLADITGDGKADIVGFGDAGVYTAVSRGDGTFNDMQFTVPMFGYNQGWRIDQHPRFAADLTGDKGADLVGFANSGVWVALSNGAGGFGTAFQSLQAFGASQGWGPQHPRLVTDLTGDGRADVIGFFNDGVWVSLGDGKGGFSAPRRVVNDLGYNQGWRVENHLRVLADVSGTGRPDIVGFGNPGVFVCQNLGGGNFAPPRLVEPDLGYNQGWRLDLHPRFVVDLSGDRKADIVGFGDYGVHVAMSAGGGAFGPSYQTLNDLGTKTAKIKHVFMLMMENRSFDHLFGFSAITGHDAVTGQPTAIDGLSGGETNLVPGLVLTQKYNVARGADFRMPQDPPHEFQDVLRQLCNVDPAGGDPRYPAGGPYPPVNNGGFAASYHKAGGNPADLFKCFAPEQIPELIELATNYAICDRWFSSMPGPTWPNRMFAHAASSGYLDDSPDNSHIAWWEVFPFAGFPFGHGTIFKNLSSHGLKWRLYSDDSFPMAAALDGVSIDDVRNLTFLGADLARADFDAQYIHIEPYYDTFGDGPSAKANSHHPVSDLRKGNELIQKVYDVIRNSPVWNDSILIVTWDEHGGFYDHVTPPAAPRPNDPKTDESREGNINHHNFAFDQYGPRVPAIIISPWIPKGTIDHRLYDHASIPATIERLFGLPPLTDRDAKANSLLDLCTLAQPRNETPERYAPPIAGNGGVDEGKPPLRQKIAATPIAAGRFGFLQSALTLDMQISPHDQAMARAQAVATDDDALQYLYDVKQRVTAYQQKMGLSPAPSPPPPAPPPPPPHVSPPPPHDFINHNGRPPILER